MKSHSDYRVVIEDGFYSIRLVTFDTNNEPLVIPSRGSMIEAPNAEVLGEILDDMKKALERPFVIMGEV